MPPPRWLNQTAAAPDDTRHGGGGGFDLELVALSALLVLGWLAPCLLCGCRPSRARLDANARPQGRIHRVDPGVGSTLIGANRVSQSNCWVSWKMMGQPCELQVRPSRGPSSSRRRQGQRRRRWRGTATRRCGGRRGSRSERYSVSLVSVEFSMRRWMY